jgi:hypothetical protein
MRLCDSDFYRIVAQTVGAEMSYQDEVATVAVKQVDAIRRDLARAQQALVLAGDEVLKLNRRVAALDWLLRLAETESTSGGPALTLHDAMRQVLSRAPLRMMRAVDLAAAIDNDGLYRMRDGRAVEPQQIHARVGNYPQLFTREGTFIKLIEED